MMIRFILHSIIIVTALWCNICSTHNPSTVTFPETNPGATFLTAPRPSSSVPLTLIQHIRSLFYLDLNHTESVQSALDKSAGKILFTGYAVSRHPENRGVFYQPWYKFLHPVSTAYYVFALCKIII